LDSVARHFTLAEAQSHIPEVDRLLRQAIELKKSYEEGEREFEGFQQRVMLMGGVALDRERVIGARKRRDEAGARLRSAIEGVQEIGCLIKDLDIGLIDFPTVYRGAEVYLCWKIGERAIEFWHGVEEGFRGRKPIDQDFLDHHGEPEE
jgi:hypothetical protein